MRELIETQLLIEKELDIVLGNQDYLDFVSDLEAIEDIIDKSPLDDLYMKYFIELAESRSEKSLSIKSILKAQAEARFILRSSILRKHLNLSLRPYSIALAATPLYQSFCGIHTLGTSLPSSSTINRLENSLSVEFLKEVNAHFVNDVLLHKKVSKQLGLKNPFTIEELYGDSTCVKANIHFPVDWVLFRDMIRTTMLKLKMIRDGGIKSKMSGEPCDYLTQINSLCMEMHSCYSKAGAVKKRKAIFRKMKKLLKKAMGHVKRHLDLFKIVWEDYSFSGVQATSIICCLEDILNRKDEIVKIAHKRIISEKFVMREDKILSIYEDKVHIIKRSKHSVKSEFGNTLQIIEQQEGFIVDYDLLEEYSPGDQQLGIASLENIKNNFGLASVLSFTGDRGYYSLEAKLNVEKLNEEDGINILYSVTPKNVTELKEKMKDPNFKSRQKRRASTEARIAITKSISNNPMRQKGIRNRQVHMGLAVLTHNLFKLGKIISISETKAAA